MKSLPGVMAAMARLQQLATSNISKYPQEATPGSTADAPKGSLQHLSVADQVCGMFHVAHLHVVISLT